jgi:hypothetical protein
MAEAEYVRALDRGLAILQAFSAQTPVLTVADAADRCGPRWRSRRGGSAWRSAASTEAAPSARARSSASRWSATGT